MSPTREGEIAHAHHYVRGQPGVREIACDVSLTDPPSEQRGEEVRVSEASDLLGIDLLRAEAL